MSIVRKRLPSGQKREMISSNIEAMMKKESLQQPLPNQQDPNWKKTIIKDVIKLQAIDRQKAVETFEKQVKNEVKEETKRKEKEKYCIMDGIEFEKEYKGVLSVLQQMQNKQEGGEEKEKTDALCKRAYHLTQEWKDQIPAIQHCCPRESLLRGISTLLQSATTKNQVRIAKTILSICSNLNLIGIYSGAESNSNITRQELLDTLNFTLKEVLEISKKPNDIGLEQSSIYDQLIQILQVGKQHLNNNTIHDNDLIELIYLIMGVLKNLSSVEEVRRVKLTEDNVTVLSHYLHFFPMNNHHLDKKLADIQQNLIQIYLQITNCLRNLSANANCISVFISTQTIDKLTLNLQHYPTHYELSLNTVRLFNKISQAQSCCQAIFANREAIKTLISFYKTQKQDIFIIIRVSFILANMTGFIEEIREMIYFQTHAFKDIYDCFQYYYNKHMHPKDLLKQSFANKFNLTTNAWDFKTLEKENDSDALLKLMRLLANLMTIPQIGSDFVSKKENYFKDLLKKVKGLLDTKNIESHQELLLCALSLLSNLCYFEKTSSLLSASDLELRTVKASVLDSLADYVIQTTDQQIQIESLRVLANVSRNKALVKQVEKTHLLKALLILLDSNDKEVVYYSLGILVNCTNEESILKTYAQQMYVSVLGLLQQCSLDELEIVLQSFKMLLILVSHQTTLYSDDPSTLDQLLFRFTEDCDIILQYSDLQSSDNTHINTLRGLLNTINNTLSDNNQPNFLCPIKKCGRKFKNQAEMDNHLERRHKTQ